MPNHLTIFYTKTRFMSYNSLKWPPDNVIGGKFFRLAMTIAHQLLCTSQLFPNWEQNIP